MKGVFLNAVAVLLMGTGLTFAQTANNSMPQGNAGPVPSAAEQLPARPIPVAVPTQDPPPSTENALAPPPRPLPISPPPPPPPPPTQLSQPLLPLDAGLDGFATRFWFSGDYLLWWLKTSSPPALVTTGSPTDAVPGALGQSGTHVLFGDEVHNPVRSGGRFRGGYWFTPDQTFGVDGGFFFVFGDAARFADSSNGVPILTRPFLNANTNQEDAFLVAFPGQQAGSITGSLSTHLWSADTNLRGMLFRGPTYQLSLLGGFRFLSLTDNLRLREMATLVPQSASEPVSWTNSVDRFGTSTQFYGGQIGADFKWSRGRFFVDVLSKVALGTSVEHADINGWSSFTTSTGQSGSIGVGRIALPSNLGRYGQDQFAVVPEVGLNLGYAVTQHIRFTFGYTFLFWSSVFRVADQIDRVINTTEFPAVVGQGTMVGPPRPNFTFKDNTFWAQGLNFGVELRY